MQMSPPVYTFLF
uniref:Uncharacterized protein n=1 Tax=Anguilla anguilla TaxID=7936 RepID=A0A0E9T9D2_ANGAN